MCDASELKAAIAETGMATIKDVCEMTGLHRETIMKRVDQGRLRVERRTIRGRPVLLFEPDDVRRFLASPDREKKNPTANVIKAAEAQGYVRASELAKKAGVSIPTLKKHMAAGLVWGETKSFAGRRLLAFEKKEADRYAKEARQIVQERTEANQSRGPVTAPEGYETLRELAQRSNINIFALYEHIKERSLIASSYRSALVVTSDEAARFVAQYGLNAPPGGLLTYDQAASLAGVNRRSIDYAVEQGYVAAVPAERIFTDDGQRAGRPESLVSEADVRAYFADGRAGRRRKRELDKLLSTSQALKDRLNNE